MDWFEDTTIFIFLIPIVVYICILLSYLKFKRLTNPITFMAIWWGGWLFIANFSLTGVYIPSFHTQSLVILMLLAYTLGALLYSKRIKYKNDININFHHLSFYKKFKSILNLVYPTLFCAILPFFIKAINIFRTSGITPEYRREAFGVGGKESILYGNSYIGFLYIFIIASVVLMFTIISAILLYTQGKKRYFAFSLILNFFQGIMMLGRFTIYSPIFILIITGFCFYGKFTAGKFIDFLKKIKIKRTKKYIVFFALLLVFGVVVISSLRNQGTSADVLEISWDYLIKYHTIGFALLSSEIENNYSLLNQEITYGKATLSGFGLLWDFVYKRLFDDRMFSIGGEVGIWGELGKYMDNFVEVGKGGLYGGTQLANAFYTMIYYFYLDGREIGVFIFSLLLGYLTSSFYTNWIKTRNLYSLTYCLIFLYGTLMSIFNYRFSPGFWVGLLVIVAFHKFTKLSNKSKT